MKINTRLRILAVATVALLGLSACSSGGEADNSSGSEGKTLTLGIVQYSGDDAFSNSALEGAAKLAESEGWEVAMIDTKGSIDEANSAMTNLMTRGVDALLVGVFSSEALGSGVADAESAGVPVANWGGCLADGVKFSSLTGLGDDYAERVVADMGGKGDILALTYPPGIPCLSREKSLEAAVEGTDINLTKQQVTIPGPVNFGNDAAIAWAAAHPMSDTPLAIWGCWDEPVVGAVAGLSQVGRTDVKTYGMNGTKEALTLVEAGDMTATLWFDGAKQGEELFKLLEEDVNNGNTSEPKEIGGDTLFIDSDELPAFFDAHPELK